MDKLEEQFLARESAQLEEVKRFNTEHEIAKALAPQKWSEFKSAFNEKCVKISKTALRYAFECEEPDSSRFFFNRIVNGVALRAVSFRFDASVPCIFFESERCGNGAITFLVSDTALYYKIGTRGVVLEDFIVDLMLKLTR